MLRMTKKIIVLVFMISLVSSLSASGIKITPVRLEFDENNQIAVLHVTNPGDAPVLLQADLRQWDQVNGIDVFKETKDILVVPPLFSILPQQTQVVRLALHRPIAPNQESTYRLFLKEIIQKSPKNKKSGLQLSLQMSIPVFVAPLNESEEEMQWQVKAISNKEILITLMNQGNITLLINELQIFSQDNKPVLKPTTVFKYILPQQSYSWTMPAITTLPNAYKIKAKINGQELTREASR